MFLSDRFSFTVDSRFIWVNSICDTGCYGIYIMWIVYPFYVWYPRLFFLAFGILFYFVYQVLYLFMLFCSLRLVCNRLPMFYCAKNIFSYERSINNGCWLLQFDNMACYWCWFYEFPYWWRGRVLVWRGDRGVTGVAVLSNHALRAKMYTSDNCRL